MMRKKVLSFLTYFIYLIILLEISLRIPYIYKRIFDIYYEKPTHLIHFFNKNKGIFLYWRLEKNFPYKLIYPPTSFFQTKENIVEAKINSLGFRGNEFKKDKKINTIRIAFIGDSFTFGWGLPDGQTYPEKVCTELQKHLPSIDFECLNFGMFGYNIFNSYNVLKDFVIDYSPDLIVFGLTINDAEKNLFSLKANMKIEREPRIPDLFEGAPRIIYFDGDIFEYLYTYRLISFLYYIHKIKEATIIYYHNLYSPVNEEWLEININALEKIKEETSKRKIPLLCLFFPVLYKLKSDYPFQKIHNFYHNIFRKNEIPYIDFYPIFKDYDESKLWVHPKDKHPNSLATDIIAKEVSTFIINNLIEK